MTIDSISSTASAMGNSPAVEFVGKRQANETAATGSSSPTSAEGSPRQIAENMPQAVGHAVEKINKFVQTLTNDIQFSVDKDTDLLLVKVVDRETKEVIRQIPSEEIVEIAKALDNFRGLLIKQQA